jgi:hypothetical protein
MFFARPNRFSKKPAAMKRNQLYKGVSKPRKQLKETTPTRQGRGWERRKKMEAEESKNWELCRAIQLHDNTHTHTQFPTLERKEAGDYGSLGLNAVFDQLAWGSLEYGRTVVRKQAVFS